MPMLKEAVLGIGAPIAAVQVEYHPFLAQTELLEFLRKHDIALTAYAPLAQGRAAQDETLKRIGAKHGVSGAEVAIAWLIEQAGVIAIPKAQRRESQRQNLEALDVKLDDADRSMIARLPKDLRYVRPSFAPNWNATTL
jgi:2,5-diketo-D-gluconate reductase B